MHPSNLCGQETLQLGMQLLQIAMGFGEGVVYDFNIAAFARASVTILPP